MKTSRKRIFICGFCAILLFTAEGQNSFCTDTSMGVKNTNFCLKSDKIFLAFVLLSFTKK